MGGLRTRAGGRDPSTSPAQLGPVGLGLVARPYVLGRAERHARLVLRRRPLRARRGGDRARACECSSPRAPTRSTSAARARAPARRPCRSVRERSRSRVIPVIEALARRVALGAGLDRHDEVRGGARGALGRRHDRQRRGHGRRRGAALGVVARRHRAGCVCAMHARGDAASMRELADYGARRGRRGGRRGARSPSSAGGRAARRPIADHGSTRASASRRRRRSRSLCSRARRAATRARLRACAWVRRARASSTPRARTGRRGARLRGASERLGGTAAAVRGGARGARRCGCTTSP